MIGRMQQEGVLAVGVTEGVVMEATAAGGLGVFGRLGTGDGEDGLEAVGEEVGELSKDFTSSSSSSSSRFNSSSKELEARGPLIASTDFGVSIFFTFSKLMLFTRLRGTIESLSSKRSRFWLDAALVDDGGGEGGSGRELIGPNRAAGFLLILGKIESGLREGVEEGLLPVDGDAGLLC